VIAIPAFKVTYQRFLDTGESIKIAITACARKIAEILNSTPKDGVTWVYSALVPGDYEKCVTNFYDSHSIWPEVRIVDQAIPVEPGAGAEPPVDGVAGWGVNKVYNKDDKAACKGVVYQAKNWTQDDDPSLGGAWEVFNGTTTPTPPPTNSNGFIEWQEGVSQVANGDKVTHAGKCYIAKNNPGVWDTPGSNPNSGWNWDQISCK
jgi:hypothetical protein